MIVDVVTLLKGDIKGKNGNLSSDEVLKNKVVAMYFSAHWCPPCRQFTPMLSQFYNELKSMGANIEIVFCSFDKDQNSFDGYYSEMPWLAIPFGDQRIKILSQKAGVQGIPYLIFVDPTTGQILHEEDGTEIVYEGNYNRVLDWCL